MEGTDWRAEYVSLQKRYDAALLQLSEERERCAKIADDLAQHHGFYDGGYEVGRKIAKAIRDGVTEKPKDEIRCVKCNWSGADEERQGFATWSRSMHETPDGVPICSHCFAEKRNDEVMTYPVEKCERCGREHKLAGVPCPCRYT